MAAVRGPKVGQVRVTDGLRHVFPTGARGAGGWSGMGGRTTMVTHHSIGDALMNRSLLPALLCLLLAPAVPSSAMAADVAPLLPSPLSVSDLTVPAGTQRVFNVAVASTDKGIGFGISSADAGMKLSGGIEFAWVDGVVLRRFELDGLETVGGYVDLSGSAGARVLQLRLLGGAQDMRINLTLPGPAADLKQGQATGVFSQLAGGTTYEAARRVRLAKPSNMQVFTWGGDAEVALKVYGPVGTGFPPLICDDQGDAWRQCNLDGLAPGLYSITVAGEGNPVQLMGRWKALP